jgi:CheY-like chemotaxis protein
VVLLAGRKLLLADDSVTIQKVVDLTFADEGMLVTTVSDGKQAIAKLEEMSPDIVLADVFMPGMSGYEVCEYMKRDERFRHIPVMLLVGSFEPFDEVEARRVGADDFLTKPFQSIRQLVSKIGALVSGKSRSGAIEARSSGAEDSPSEQRKPESDEGAAQPLTAAAAADTLERSTADTRPLPEYAGGETHPVAISDAPVLAHAAAADSGGETIREGASSWVSATSPAGTVGKVMPADGSVASHQEKLLPADIEEPGVAADGEAVTGRAERTTGELASHEVGGDTLLIPASAGQQTKEATETVLDLGDAEPWSPSYPPGDQILDIEVEGGGLRSPAITPQSIAAGASQGPEEQHGQTVSQVREHYEGEVSEAQHALSSTEEEESVRRPAEPAEPAVSSSTTTSAASAGLIRPEQLSPEAVDLIARRAVELLSEKVIQEIAWEVVPQLAELLIKRRLEQDEKSRAK